MKLIDKTSEETIYKLEVTERELISLFVAFSKMSNVNLRAARDSNSCVKDAQVVDNSFDLYSELKNILFK